MIGIYIIKNIKNGKQYIGSSVNIDKRWAQHRADLRNNHHHCMHLQRAWNKHGEENFQFLIAESVNKEILLEREQWYLDNEEHLYNVGKNACGGDNLSKHSEKEQIIKKRRETAKRTYTNMTAEQRKQKFGKPGKLNGMYGKKHTEEVKEKLRKQAKEAYETGKNQICNRLGKTNEEMYGKEKANQISKKLSQYGNTRTGSKNPFYGKHHTEEFKLNASAREKARRENMSMVDKLNHPQFVPILIDNKLYFGCAEAARELGCTPANITYKLKHKKHSNYNYIDKKLLIKYINNNNINNSSKIDTKILNTLVYTDKDVSV